MQKLIDQELGPLIDERRFRNRDRDEPRERVSDAGFCHLSCRCDSAAEIGADQVFCTWPGQRKWAEEKIMIELEPLRNFNVRAKVVGPGVSR